MVESSQGELLIVHKIMDTVFSDGEDEEAAEGEGVMIYKKLIRFEVFKFDPISSDTMRFTKLNMRVKTKYFTICSCCSRR